MSKIQWTGETWNPLGGCSKVSAGCAHCYAEVMAKRLAAMGQQKYIGTVDERGRWTGTINLDESALNKPLTRQKSTVYFVNSMSDLFHENVPTEVIDKIFHIMALCPQHTFQVLTKRPKRMFDFLSSPVIQKLYPGLPFPNVWLGVSVENQQAADERIPILLQTPAAVRFLSCEPLLDSVDLTRINHGAPKPYHTNGLAGYCDNGNDTRIDWVICGGESGPGARPMHPDWARSLRDQCQAAGVPFFFKQWGEWAPRHLLTADQSHGKKAIDLPCGSPNDHWFYRVGKKAAGRMLDGRTWDEMPGGGHG